MISIVNNFLDKIFNTHSIIFNVGSTELININVGWLLTICLLLTSALFIGFLGFKVIRWFVKKC
jgi:hypothetical protein